MNFTLFVRYTVFLIAATISVPFIAIHALAQTETAQVAPVAKHIETWKGTLDLGIKLELGLKVYQEADGKLSAKLDSYTQQALGIPVVFRRDGDSYKFSSKALGLSYEATLSADKSAMKGTFKQGAVTTDLEFQKVDLNYEVKPNRPQTPKAP